MYKGTPTFKFGFVMVLGFLVAFGALKLALHESKLGTPLAAGMNLKSPAGALVLEGLDFTTEPGELETKQDLNRFYERQEQITHIFSQKPVQAEKGPEFFEVPMTERSITDLSVLFWIPILVGLGALAISGWIWALRSRDLSSTLFALSGLSTFISAVPSAIYTTRELALPKTLFQILETLNAWGATGFGISVLALFLVYPKKPSRWKRVAVGQAVFFTVWTAAFSLQLVPDWANISLIIVSLMLCICVAIGFQFFATKNHPTQRAALVWLGLSVLIGAGAFVVFTSAPLVLGLEPFNQGYAFSFFLIIYLGLAAGLTKYKLFEVGQWAFRFLYYALGATMFVLFDAGLVFVLGLGRVPALGASLLAVGFLYLPLRDYIWRFFSKRNRMESEEMLAEALHVAFSPSDTERASRWETLLRKMFEPLEIKVLSEIISEVEIRADGLVLAIPPIAGNPPLQLSYPWSGQGLFNNRSRTLVIQILSFVEKAESNREAYDRGVTEERRRMAQDLHDDVGARLLTGLHLADEKMRPTLQGALADIRSIVSEMSGEKVGLAEVLSDLRFETVQRLSLTGIDVQWAMLSENESQDFSFDYRQRKAIASALREVVSNVIRHSGASVFTVQIERERNILKLSLRDNGRGLSTEVLNGESTGHGIKNIKRRMRDFGGTVQLSSDATGTRLLITLSSKES